MIKTRSHDMQVWKDFLESDFFFFLFLVFVVCLWILKLIIQESIKKILELFENLDIKFASLLEICFCFYKPNFFVVCSK